MADGIVHHQTDPPPPSCTRIRYTGGHVEDLEIVEEKLREMLPESIRTVDKSEPDKLTVWTKELDEAFIRLIQIEFDDWRVGGQIHITRRAPCQDTCT